MPYLNRRTLIVLTLLLLVCAACGPSIIRGRPPFISIASLNLDQEQMTVVFSVSNQNGEPMDINGVEIRVQLEEAELTRYNENFQLKIDANSTEDVTVNQAPDENTRNLLNSLERGELISLPFDLEGRVNTVADGYLKFRNKGHLYPVPGRPGQFRSATTHSSRIDNEDPFKEIKSPN
jgi:LEA14-like dessication related protein